MAFKIDWVITPCKWAASVGKYLKYEGSFTLDDEGREQLEVLINRQASMIVMIDNKKLNMAFFDGVSREQIRADLKGCVI